MCAACSTNHGRMWAEQMEMVLDADERTRDGRVNPMALTPTTRAPSWARLIQFIADNTPSDA